MHKSIDYTILKPDSIPREHLHTIDSTKATLQHEWQRTCIRNNTDIYRLYT